MTPLKHRLAVVMLSALLVLPIGAEAAGLATVKADALRLRKQANTSSRILAMLPHGTKASVIEQTDGWYKVTYNGTTGFLSADYVTFSPSGDAAAGFINGSGVNFREAPSTASAVLGVFPRGCAVTVLSSENGWHHVQAMGQTGYVSKKYVTLESTENDSEQSAQETPRGIVTGTTVNVRSGAGTDYSIVTCVSAGTVIELGALADGWYAMTYQDTSGYICADYVCPYQGDTASAIGASVVELALSFLGTPYVYGGASAKGFDCSGFTMYIFEQFGYSLSHSASAQWQDAGVFVEYDDLQPGDLVLFNDPSRNAGRACSHVGIYIGDGEFVHASSGSRGKKVITSSLTSGYYHTYYKGAKRIG